MHLSIPPPLSNTCFLCSICGKKFKSLYLDRLPTNIIAEFKEILTMEIHKKLVLNFRTKGKYKCIFQGEKAYEIINPVPWNPSTSHNQSEEEVHPLEQLIYQQSLIKKQARQPQFLHGEILIEWKKHISNEKV
nr:6248_t:CDS:2 [Entrophospora candida]